MHLVVCSTWFIVVWLADVIMLWCVLCMCRLCWQYAWYVCFNYTCVLLLVGLCDCKYGCAQYGVLLLCCVVCCSYDVYCSVLWVLIMVYVVDV